MKLKKIRLFLWLLLTLFGISFASKSALPQSGFYSAKVDTLAQLKIFDSLCIKYNSLSVDSLSKYANKYITLARDYKQDPNSYSRAILHCAVVCEKRLQYDSLMYYSHLGETFANLHKLLESSNRFISFRGRAYALSGMYDMALHSYLEALELAEQMSFVEREIDLLAEIAQVYHDIGDIAKAKQYMKSSLELSIRNESIIQQQVALNSLGSLYLSIDVDSARLYFKQAFDLLQYDKSIYEPSISNLAVSYYIKGDLDSAIYYQKVGIGYSRELNDAYSALALYNNLGCYQTYTGELELAQANLDTALQLCTPNSKQLEVSVRESFADLMVEKGDYKQALAYYQAADAIKAEIDEKAASAQAKVVDAVYSTEKKDLEIRSKTIQLRFIAGVALLSIVVLVVLLVYRRKMEALRLLKSVNNALEAERRRLASDLHDDLGTELYILDGKCKNDGQMEEKEVRELKQQIKHVQNLSRTISHDIMPPKFERSGIINAMLSQVVKVEQQSGVDIRFSHQVGDDALLPSTAINLYRSFQELLKNSVTHGKASHIYVSFNSVGRTLKLSVSDDGVGFDPDKLSDVEGIGIRTLKARIALLRGVVKIESILGEGSLTEIEIKRTVFKKQW